MDVLTSSYIFSHKFVMDLHFVCIVFKLCFVHSHEIKASSFSLVNDSSITEYNNAIVVTNGSRTSNSDCARSCNINCLAFIYDRETKECKLFIKPFSPKNTTLESTNVVKYVKTVTQLNSNPADCSEINQDVYSSGIYRITPTPGVSFDVYCDMDTADGPWTVIQNRRDGEVDFYRNWADYKQGFGNLRGNFWLGNDNIHLLTVPDSSLRIQLVGWIGGAAYADYSTFRVGAETEKYRLTVSGFSGNTQDNMALHNGMSFTTKDMDNDLYGGSCAILCKGGWWYKSCYDANLNGAEYMAGDGNYKAPVWDDFYPGVNFPHMKKTRMLVKRRT